MIRSIDLTLKDKLIKANQMYKLMNKKVLEANSKIQFKTKFKLKKKNKSSDSESFKPSKISNIREEIH